MSSGVIAAWVGASGTWVVGIVVGWIAWLQFDHGRFKPQVMAYRDSRNRIAIRITNRGAGTGAVEDVDLLKGGHGSDTPSVFYEWEISGEPHAGPAPIPFTLTGLSTAQLILRPRGPLPGSVKARVRYGNNRRSPCVSIIAVQGAIFGTTSIPGIS